MRRAAVLAALALAILPAGAAAKPGHHAGAGVGDPAGDPYMLMGGPPTDIRAGETWNAIVLASWGDEPIVHQNIAVTVSNPYTGRAQTYYSDETAPGHYVADVVFPTKGTWEIAARGGGLVADAPTADVAPPPADPSPWPWVLGAAVAATLLAGAAALASRARHRHEPAPAPAEG